MGNKDLSYCNGCDSQLCKKCLRYVSKQSEFSNDAEYIWWITPKYNELTKTCKNYIQK